ncbi:MICOS complex subunit Mic27 [Clupea harengus]|uniref:MICOS complex subunit n=1 Tax=Clupea harengus TaxID=7950 RepID=A0A6P3W546_CLUHA|nr:MICOS complex subunit Mic27 [Clupea harengus]
MSPKVVKFLVVPATAVFGIASIRVHAMGGAHVEGLLTQQQLSIYTPVPQKKFHYVDEQPGALQSALGTVRQQLQSYLRAVKGSLLSTKLRVGNIYHAGEDVYHYLKDPPPGFLPRVGVITGAGLTGLILARRGSRLRRLLLPLGLASLGAGVCYPAHSLAFLKVSGRQAWSASQWSASAVSSLWRTEPSAAPPAPPPPPISPAADSQRSQASRPEPPAPSGPPAPPASDPPTGDTTLPRSPAAPQASGSAHAVPTSRPGAQTSPPAGKPGFTADPRLMDFGQSSPEDADLYSTRG